LRLISELPVDGYEAALDAAMAHPRLREILDAVARMAFAGWAEYYNSPEWACQTIQREIAIASDLAEETVCLSCGKPIAIDDLWDFRHGGDDRRPRAHRLRRGRLTGFGEGCAPVGGFTVARRAARHPSPGCQDLVRAEAVPVGAARRRVDDPLPVLLSEQLAQHVSELGTVADDRLTADTRKRRMHCG
jgi:hypothetical protein